MLPFLLDGYAPMSYYIKYSRIKNDNIYIPDDQKIGYLVVKYSKDIEL